MQIHELTATNFDGFEHRTFTFNPVSICSLATMQQERPRSLMHLPFRSQLVSRPS